MNSKKTSSMKPAIYIPAIILGLAVPSTIAYYVGQKSNDESAETLDTAANNKGTDAPNVSNKTTPNKNQMSNTTTPQKRAVTPEVIAKAKNVPAVLENPQGNFTLVAVVEGAEANRKLNQSLQVVGAQRQRLALLSRQFDTTPAASVQQRELIAGQINETRKTLEGNLRFMAQNYAYSLNNNYVMIPHQAALLAVTEEDGKQKVELVHEFKSSTDYEAFQKDRDAYLRLKLEQAKAAQAAKKEVMVKNGEATEVEDGVPENDSVAEKESELKPTAEMEEKRSGLQETYRYDPERNYQINFEKTALYARPVR